MVRLVTAVIKPHKLDEVKDALRAMGVLGLTASEVRGMGRQGGHTETYRGAEYTVEFVPKVKIEILCGEDVAEQVADTIAEKARTGKIGDGKIWITPVDTAIRVRTGERDVEAV